MHSLGDYLRDFQLPEPKKENYGDIEAEFKGLVEHLQVSGLVDMPQVLKLLRTNQVPAAFRRSFGFFKSLSGPSRGFMIDVAQGRKLHRRCTKGKMG